MAQTSYDQYLQQLMGDAYQQQGQGGMMAQPRSIAPANVSGINNAMAALQSANANYKAPELSDLNKVREDFLAKRAAEEEAKLKEQIAAAPQGMMRGGSAPAQMSDAAFYAQLTQGISNVEMLRDMGLISPETSAALISDALGKLPTQGMDAALPNFDINISDLPPAPTVENNRRSSSSGGGGGYNATFGSMSGAEGAAIGGGGE